MKEHFFSNAEKIALAVIIVASILAVICALKPADYKKSPANVIMEELDYALTQVAATNSLDGTFKKLYKLNSTEKFDITKGKEYSKDFGMLLEKYMENYDKPCEDKQQCGACKNYEYSFLLKSGACIGVTTGQAKDTPTIFPGEKAPSNSTSNYGVIFFDINSINAPNQAGKDQFLVPLGIEGIEYAAEGEEAEE